MRLGIRLLFLYVLVILLAPAKAVAEIVIDITSASASALPIAIVPFAVTAPGGAPVDVSGIITTDLKNSGRFKPMAPSDMPSRPSNFDQIQFADWRRLGMENLVVGQVTEAGPDQYQIEFRLVDVYKGEQLTGFKVTTSSRNMRFRTHQIADLIYEKLTGIPGAFATRITYVAVNHLDGKNKRYMLQIADADGYDPRTIYESSEPVLSPAWSPDGRKIAFVSFEEHRSNVYIQDLISGKRDKISTSDGLNSAPAWSPDGTRLALTLSREGNADIYIYQVAGGSLQRITDHRAIDTEPAWSPDGKQLVFTSDRGGTPQIYRLALGSNTGPVRVTYKGDYNARASFAPNGKLLTMVHNDGGGYRIATLDLEYQDLTVITKNRLDESPSFAPNGSMLVYAASGSRGSELRAVSVDGGVHLSLAAQFDEVREPAWGPFRN
jgi:TolB protein